LRTRPGEYSLPHGRVFLCALALSDIVSGSHPLRPSGGKSDEYSLANRFWFLSCGHRSPGHLIADASIERERVSKLTAYAQAGIPDYWIINLIDQQVEVYRQPRGLEYAEKQVLKGDTVISPLILPTAEITARQLLANPRS
jgi:hypothetical protein